MLPTRIRPAGVALLASCLCLSGTGRSDEIEKAPPPRPVVDDHEQIRKELEAKLAGRAPAEVLAFVERLAQEWPARKGAYEVAHSRFKVHAAELKAAQQRLDGLKPPPEQTPLVLRPADVEAAVKDAQTRADHSAARVKYLEELKNALAAVVAAGTAFDRAVTAADEHLLKMRTAAALAAKTGAATLPDAVATKQLDDAVRTLTTLSVEMRPTVVKAQVGLVALANEPAHAKAIAAFAAAKLIELKDAQAETLAALKFAEETRSLTPAQLAGRFTELRKQLAEKIAAIEGDNKEYAEARARAEIRKIGYALSDPFAGAGKEPAVVVPSASPLEATAGKLLAVQQYLAARVRAIDTRAEEALTIVATLDELEKKAKAYSNTLNDARLLAGQTTTLASEIGRRVGTGDIEPGKVPDGTAEAVTFTGRAKLDADATDVQTVLDQLRQERDALRKPDLATQNIKTVARQLLAQVNDRIELLAEQKRLAAHYATARKDRPEAEQKRLDQHAIERMNRDESEWDWVLACDRSKPGADASELLAAYYKELIDHDERAENLNRQRETLAGLVKLTQREADDVAKLRVLLEKRTAASEDAKAWDAWLAVRLAPGLKGEAEVYHEETARLNAVAGVNARRVESLTGNAPTDASKAEQTKLPANGGEIGRARNELSQARLHGLRTTAIKINIIILGALLIPRLLLRILGRAIRGGTDETGNPSPVLASLRGVLKAGTWLAAIALVLSILGYDVTALVIALAIGVLAVALAARPMIADVLGSVVIFAERRFKVGDVVRLGTGEPARVVGLTWRSTALKNTSGLVVSVPNRTVTETTVENLSKGAETYDAIAVTVSTDKDAGKVINVIRGAVVQCKNVSADNGVTVMRYHQKGGVKVVEYRFWWFLKDYEMRNKTRDEVFARIALGLAHEDMTGIEIMLG